MNAAEQKLVDALRSGKYEQTQLVLRDHRGFCCLGVACDVLYPELWSDTPSENSSWWHGSGKYGSELSSDVSLSVETRKELNWNDVSGVLLFNGRCDAPNNPGHYCVNGTHPLTLVDLNDGGFSFNQIADVIAAGLVAHTND